MCVLLGGNWGLSCHFSPFAYTEQRPAVLLINICIFDVLEAKCREIKTRPCQLFGTVRTGRFPHVAVGLLHVAALLLEMLQVLRGSPAGSGHKEAQQGCLPGRSGPSGQEEGVFSWLHHRFTPRNFSRLASMPWWDKERVLAERLRAAAPVCPCCTGP